MRAIVKADPKTGNENLEAFTHFRECPRAGESIEVVLRDPTGGAPEVVWLDVERVVHCLSDQEVEVWVDLDEYDLDKLEAAMRALRVRVAEPTS